MTATTTLHAGHDVAYFTRGQGSDGCVGAMSYYTAAGEPPGEWAGKAAARLGLTGQVDPGVIERLYQQNIGPSGEVLARRRRQSKAADQREDAAVSAHLAEHPFASAVELAEVRAAARAKDPHRVPYFDLTISAVKSVSVLHASYRVSARQARERSDDNRAAELDKKADDIEQALIDAAKAALEWLERYGTFTRTGHHSAHTGETTSPRPNPRRQNPTDSPPLSMFPSWRTRPKPLARPGQRPSRVSRNPSLTKNPPPTSASQVTALPGWTNSRPVRTRPRNASPPTRPSSRPAPSTSRESSARRRPSLSLTGPQSGTKLRSSCSRRPGRRCHPAPASR